VESKNQMLEIMHSRSNLQPILKALSSVVVSSESTLVRQIKMEHLI